MSQIGVVGMLSGGRNRYVCRTLGLLREGSHSTKGTHLGTFTLNPKGLRGHTWES